MIAVAGWAVAALLVVAVLALRRRLELVADAEHELRGPTAALGLAVEAMRREPGGARRSLAFESQLDRIGAGLADLAAARAGRRASVRPSPLVVERAARAAAAGWRPAAMRARRLIRVRWDAGHALVRADRGRLSQALGNLVANALEHGSGRVELRGRRVGRVVRIEVRDSGPADRESVPQRGRGLAIAERAAREAGGSVTLERQAEGTVAAVELPVVER